MGHLSRLQDEAIDRYLADGKTAISSSRQESSKDKTPVERQTKTSRRARETPPETRPPRKTKGPDSNSRARV